MAQPKNQKKLISFANFDLVNSLVKDEAIAKNRNESAIIEDIILDRYLSNNKNLAMPITLFLFEERGVARAAENVFAQFAALPEYVDDTAYPLVEWVRQLEWRFPTDLNKSGRDLSHFMRSVGYFKEIIQKYYERTDLFERVIKNLDGKDILIEGLELEGDLDILGDIISVYERQQGLYQRASVANILTIICRYWNMPLPDERPLHKFSYLYRWFVDLMGICDYPATPELRYNFVRIVRGIKFYEK